MLIKKNLFFINVLLIALTGIGQPQKAPAVIEGRVITETNGQPVANAHVYIIDGEEEALTNSNGEFSIESWQKAPITLTVDTYRHYRKTSIVVANPSKKQLIRLKTKP